MLEILASLLLLPASLTSAQERAELELADHAALHAALARITAAHPAVASTITLGISREGRVLEGLALSGADAPSKPAILVVANLAGPAVFDSALALDHAARLAERYGSDPAVTAFLDSTRVYVVPRANPDAAEARFQTPLFERESGGHGIDDDRDGRGGEDGPADVDGDGRILRMRVPDPEGTWIEDPTDARALREAVRAQGERGRWRLDTEGRDADGDEHAAEDPEHDTHLNESFPAGWKAHAPHAGLFPTDEPEARALLEFVIAHEDVALVLCYGSPENLVTAPKGVADDAPAVKRVPPEGVLQSDADLLSEIGRRYRELTKNESKDDARSDAGTFQRWCYEHRGLLTMTALPWRMPEEPPKDAEKGKDAEKAEDSAQPEPEDAAVAADDAGAPAADPAPTSATDASATEESAAAATDGEKAKAAEQKEDEPKPSQDAKRLKWIDAAGESERFVPWTPFEHPELGPVEIGGFAPFALREPPRAEWPAIADRHLEFLLSLGALLPRVALAECEARALGPSLWRVTAVVENTALLPLHTRAGRRANAIRPARLALAGGEIVAGPARVLIDDLAGSGGRSETTWLVRADDPAELLVTVLTPNAGVATARPEVLR